MNESQRLVPVGAMGPIRQLDENSCSKSTTTRRSVSQKVMPCFYPHILPFHDPSIFTEPEIFRPERWNEASEDMKRAFITFSLGGNVIVLVNLWPWPRWIQSSHAFCHDTNFIPRHRVNWTTFWHSNTQEHVSAYHVSPANN